MSKIAASNSRPGTAVPLAEEETEFSEAVTTGEEAEEAERGRKGGGAGRNDPKMGALRPTPPPDTHRSQGRAGPLTNRRAPRELQTECIAEAERLTRNDAVGRHGAVGLVADRDQALFLERVANVELDAPVNLLGEAAGITHPQIEVRLRRPLVGILEVVLDLGRVVRVARRRVAKDDFVLVAAATT